jgi:hypothetical protein
LAEFIQNADDAKATEIDIGLDERIHHGNKVPGEAGEELQGHAFTVYNNETFSEQDFQNITNTGDSGKRQDASKTGRFCLGINTAFHLGDCILLVTGHRLVAFDPTRKFFPEPLLVEFGQGDTHFADEYPDFCRPFLAYGINFREEYKGTLFRIPLRTKVEAGGLSKRMYSAQEIWDELLDVFSENAAQCLLFLKKLHRITVHSLTATGRREVCRAEVDLLHSPSFLSQRTALFERLLAKPTAGGKLQVPEYHQRLKTIVEEIAFKAEVGEVFVKVDLITSRSSRLSRRAVGAAVIVSRSTWYVCTRVAAHEAAALALGDCDALEERRIPIVQVALCMQREGQMLPKIDGRVHVALPLIDEVFWGMHANIFADTTPDRRKLLRSQERHIVAWSTALMEDGCAKASASLIHLVAQEQVKVLDLTPSAAALADEGLGQGTGVATASRHQPQRRNSLSDSDSDREDVGRGVGFAGGKGGEGEGSKEGSGFMAPTWYSLFPQLDDGTQDKLLQALWRAVYTQLWQLPVMVTFSSSGAETEGGQAVLTAELCRASEAMYIDPSSVPQANLRWILGQVIQHTGMSRLIYPSAAMVKGFKAAGLALQALTPQALAAMLHHPAPSLRRYLSESNQRRQAVTALSKNCNDTLKYTVKSQEALSKNDEAFVKNDEALQGVEQASSIGFGERSLRPSSNGAVDVDASTSASTHIKEGQECQSVEKGAIMEAHVACLAYILAEAKACKYLTGAALGLTLDGTLHDLPPAPSHTMRAAHDSDSDSDSDHERVFQEAHASRHRRARADSDEDKLLPPQPVLDMPSCRGEEETEGVLGGEEEADIKTLYIASSEQKQLFGGASGPLAARILQLDCDALHSSLVARLMRACSVVPIFKSAEHLCRAIPLLLPPTWRRVARVTAQQIQSHLQSGQAGWFSLENISALWRHLGTFSDLHAKHLAPVVGAGGGGGEGGGRGPAILPTRCGNLIRVSLSPWFDVGDLSVLEAEELDGLARFGCVFVECELHSIPRQVY